MDRVAIEKAEKELVELKDILKSVTAKINKTGGQKSQLWLFHTRHKIYNLEDKIKDLKANIIRTDAIPIEGTELEKRISSLQDSLGETIKGDE